MKNTILSLTTIIALTATSFAGGKYAAPVEAAVEPIPVTVSPVPLYLGIGAVAAFIKRDACRCDPDGANLKDRRYGGVVRAGWDFNDYIGIEARVLKTFGSDAFSETQHYGLYLKPQYHMMDQMNIYGLLGYGRTTIDYTNGIMSSTLKENGFAYGAGLEYDLSSDENLGEYARGFDGQGDQEKGWGLWMDYQNLLMDKGATHTDSHIITAGITYDF